jgi:pyruvate/2-oxoglutarate dehydrogenase complex dihydrolipoamide acyltransferase (E2) component
MPVVSIRIPQIGEGLQEARLVAVLKQPGDKVKRDEPIYQMETDKAVMDVESPYEGILTEWLAPVDTILPIGGEVAKMDVVGAVEEAPAHGHGAPAAKTAVVETPAAVAAAPAGPARNADVPPKTRAYAKEKGIADDVLGTIPAKGSKLLPTDVDAFLSNGGGILKSPAPAAKAKPGVAGAFAETPVSSKQRILNSRMVRANALVVPGTISCAINWEPIERVRAKVKAAGGDFQPSAFTMFAFAVAQALKKYSAFRTSMPNDETYRTYNNVQLGIAVGLDSGDLVTAVIEDADALNWMDFAARAKERIDSARAGKDQVTEAVTISLTNMQNFGLRDAVPVVVSPSMATLFIGEIYNGLANDIIGAIKLQRTVNLGLTFDHRVVNGVGAANFLKAIKENAENIEKLVG